MSSIMVEVKFYTYLQTIVGEKKLNINLEQGADLKYLFDKLSDTYGEEFEKNIYGTDGTMQVTCLINGHFAGSNRQLEDGDKISIMAFAGGG